MNMMRASVSIGVVAAAMVVASCSSTPTERGGRLAGVMPQASALPGAPVTSSRDRVYTADQTSNTVSVIDPSTDTPDGKLLGVISVTSNSVTIIVTATNKIRGQMYVGARRTRASSPLTGRSSGLRCVAKTT